MTTYKTLDEFVALVEEADSDNPPDLGAVEAFLLCLLMRWEAEEDNDSERAKSMTEELSGLNKVLDDVERVEVLKYLASWASEEGMEWIPARLLPI